MNKQEIFDQVARHLLTQKELSLNQDSNCMYRGDNGMMCAVGCLIPDELYTEDIENKVASSDVVVDLLRSAGVIEYEEGDDRHIDEIKFLSKLQTVHDSSAPYNWLSCLWSLARKHNLKDTVLGEFK